MTKSINYLISLYLLWKGNEVCGQPVDSLGKTLSVLHRKQCLPPLFEIVLASITSHPLLVRKYVVAKSISSLIYFGRFVECWNFWTFLDILAPHTCSGLSLIGQALRLTTQGK